jgi:DNA modification methylase
MTVQVLTGDARDLLPTLPERSVQCVVTSPPYWNLRSYLPAEHDDKAREIGAEASPAAFAQTLVDVFALVHRVLRDDGTCWVNIGDSYAGIRGNTAEKPGHDNKAAHGTTYSFRGVGVPEGIPPKSLCLIPQRLAIALQDWGWIVRSVIVWAKPNPMPESVQDRPTTAHEYILLLAKQERYYYDATAVAEHAVKGDAHAGARNWRPMHDGNQRRYEGQSDSDRTTRNLRSVWTVATEPYAAAHFATFPQKLIEPCILAGSSPRACPTCRAPWRRVVEHKEPVRIGGNAGVSHAHADGPMYRGGKGQWDAGHMPMVRPVETTGWQPTCFCPENDGSGRCVVLDPFGGSGTTAMVATKHGRDAILIDLNPAYAVLQDDRTSGVQMSLESMVL